MADFASQFGFTSGSSGGVPSNTSNTTPDFASQFGFGQSQSQKIGVPVSSLKPSSTGSSSSFLSGVGNFFGGVIGDIKGLFTPPGGQPTPIKLNATQLSQIQSATPNPKIGIPVSSLGGGSAQLSAPLNPDAPNIIDHIINQYIPTANLQIPKTGNNVVDTSSSIFDSFVNGLANTPKQAIIGAARFYAGDTGTNILGDLANVALLPLTLMTFGAGGEIAATGERSFMQVIKDSIPLGAKYGFGFGTLQGLSDNVNAPNVQTQIGKAIIQGVLSAPVGVLSAVGLGVFSKAFGDYIVSPVAKAIVDKWGMDGYNFLANRDLIQRVVTGKGSPEDIKQFKILNDAGITADVARSGEASINTESPKTGKIWDILRSLYPKAVENGDITKPETTPLKELPAGDPVDTQKLGADYIQTVKEGGDAPAIFNLTSSQAVDLVSTSNLKDTPGGQEILKKAFQAKQINHNVEVSIVPKGGNLPIDGLNLKTPEGNTITKVDVVSPPAPILDANGNPQSVVAQLVNPQTGDKVYKTIAPEQIEQAKQLIDASGGQGIIDSEGYTVHLTAKSPEQMVQEGFHEGGELNLADIPAPKDVSFAYRQLQEIKYTLTPQDNIINPIIDRIDAILKSNAKVSPQSQPETQAVRPEDTTNQGGEAVSTQTPNTTELSGQPTEQNSGEFQPANSSSQSQNSSENSPELRSDQGVERVNSGSESTNTGRNENVGTNGSRSGVSESSSGTADRAIGSGRSLKPPGGSGEQVVDKHALYVEARALDQKLTDNPFATLSTHERTVERIQKDRIAQFYKDNPDLALQVALGEANAPEDILPEGVLNYVIKQTHDLPTLMKLGNSPFNDVISAHGLGLWATKLFREPTAELQTTSAIKNINKKANDANKAKIENQIIQVKKMAKKEMEKINLSKEDLSWDKFLESIKC